MVDRDRTMPLLSDDDPLWYVPLRGAYIYGEYTTFSEDSIVKYAHDLLQLEVIMHAVFDKSLHHHSAGFKTSKTQKARPILIYEDLTRYFYGQDNQGIQAARDALNNYKTNPAHSIRADLVLFTDAIVNLEYALSSTLDDSICLFYLYDFFKADRRFGPWEFICSEYASIRQS